MYISKVKIKNYRSIKDLTINFNPGKNIIVGKNNSGKSNIIKAINIVLGENSPTYEKYNNINENDFYCNGANYENKMLIFCELKKNLNEEIDINEIVNAKLYFKYFPDQLTDDDINLENDILFYNNDLLADAIGIKTNSMFFSNRREYRENVTNNIINKNTYAFLFTAEIKDNKIEKNLKFLVKNDNEKWDIHTVCTIRNILLQSAIIPAFRDPNTQLSLSQYSWYGKMIREAISCKQDKFKDSYSRALKSAKKISDKIFDDLTNSINKSSLSVAFPNTKLYFKFIDDRKNDLYKSTKIYIDDGFLSDISLKGAGIQSAIIISLFTYYIKNISKVKNALLCIEEPELYLHPQGKRVISNRINEFLSIGNNQAIVVTHASEFIELKTKNSKVIRIYKSDEKGTYCKEVLLDNYKEVIINNENKELFFADKVILCEGKEKYLLNFINEKYLNGYLDNNNISIISVLGKNNFKKYIDITKKLNIKVCLVADFDYLLRDINIKNFDKNLKYHGSIADLSSSDLKYLSGEDTSDIQSLINRLRCQLKSFDIDKFYKSKTCIDFNKFIFKYKGDVYKIGDCLKIFRNNNIFIQNAEVEGLFKIKIDKLSEEDICKLYSEDDFEKNLNKKQLFELIRFIKKF